MNETDRLAAVNTYVDKVLRELASGQATEHSYRPALKELLGALDESIEAINEPKQSEFGAPDFVIIGKKNKDIKLGYGEAKIPGESLDKIEKSDQMDRYRGYANLFLTDCFDWRFYRNGDKIFEISIGETKRGDLQPSKLYSQNYTQLADELANFLAQTPESIKSGKRLAEIMGGKARRIRDNVAQYLNDQSTTSQELVKMYDMMKRMLVHDLSEEKFADMYAQTLVYGLFVARYGDTSPDTFTRSEARDLVPASNPFLRHFFDHIVGPSFDTRLGYIVDELCEVFSVSNVQEIVHKHLRIQDETEDAKDPIIHFYEDFLQQYDPAERKRMGAYYTPTPVVKYIVRQVDRILKEEFGLTKGLASTETIQYEVEVGQDLRADRRQRAITTQTLTVPRVQVLDPAVGTATFLNETIKFIHKEFEGQEGRWPSYVNDNLLKRLHGFELMMAPYTIAHLKLGMTLKETGVDRLTERLGVYLTNTLEEGIPQQPDLFSFGLAEAVSEESRLAAEVKSERPVMVVMGNPPYSVSSNNKGKYIQDLISDYKRDLNERKINLDDDYIKFIRFAEDMITKNGSGIVAMITNNSYIDGITHRQMRKHLLQTFDKIYVLDLHGSSMKQEKNVDGSIDENVFDIMQGVSIVLMVKTKKSLANPAELYHAGILGSRRVKFDKLNSNELKFTEIKAVAPNHFFVPRNNEMEEKYIKFIKIDNLFVHNNSGIQSKRDKIVFPINPSDSKKIVDDFKGLSSDDIRQKYQLPPDGRDWKVEWAQDDLRNGTKWTNVLYRPFDSRLTAIGLGRESKGFIAYPRWKTLSNFVDVENVGLVTVRQQSTFDFQHAIVTNSMIESGAISLQTKEWGYIFPLYIYHEDGTRAPNFAPAELSALTRQLTSEQSPEDILDYIYAVLHSPSYREKYKEFLKIDFPRVPIPTQADFERLVPLGRELRELHLMKSPTLGSYATTYPVAGSDEVEKIKYEDGNVYINDTQYFGNVPEVAWDFYIGGYQPAQKWLKDRKGRALSSDDIDHYQRVIKILLETERIMKEIG